jgi:hypothetical protein
MDRVSSARIETSELKIAISIARNAPLLAKAGSSAIGLRVQENAGGVRTLSDGQGFPAAAIDKLVTQRAINPATEGVSTRKQL